MFVGGNSCRARDEDWDKLKGRLADMRFNRDLDGGGAHANSRWNEEVRTVWHGEREREFGT